MHIDLYHHKSAPHLNQIFAGFKALERQGLLTTTVIRGSKPVFADANLPIVRVCIDKQINMVYDAIDGYRFDHERSLADNVQLLDEVLETNDLYFKRSYSSALNTKLSNTNIFPLGLNYKVYNDLYDERLEKNLLFSESARLLMTRNRLLARWFNVEYYKDLLFENLCLSPADKADYFYKNSILFLTRPWDPSEPGLPLDVSYERHQINEFRAACIRACRREFGSHFIGGFSDSPYAQSNYPDLIVPKSLTSKSNYINIMRQSSICIATTGLHDSIGWKFGEYVSHSKVILSEPLKYELPGNFSAPDNYISFRSADELLREIHAMKNNQQRMADMMRKNFDYYNKWVRPDSMIMNTLTRATATQTV